MSNPKDEQGQPDAPESMLTPEVREILEQCLARIQNGITGYGTVALVIEKRRIAGLIPAGSIRF